MLDRIFASLSLLLFVAFLSFLFLRVNALDLRIVIIIVVIFAAFDFWRETRSGASNDR